MKKPKVQILYLMTITQPVISKTQSNTMERTA